MTPLRHRVAAALVTLATAATGSDAVGAIPQLAPAARVHRVALVLFEGAELFEVVGPGRILDAVPGFTTFTVAASHSIVASDLATIVPDFTYDDAPPPDVIVVGSGGGLRDIALREWLKKNGPRAEAVLSVCNGALVLANAGLLDGRAATCPSGNFDGLMVLGKGVRALKGRRFVHDGNVFTCDSYFAGVDGALEVVKVLSGEAAARSSAASNLYDWKVPPPEPGPDATVATPPTHQVAIFRLAVEQGVDPALAAYRKWCEGGKSERGGPLDPRHERMGFHILGWTLEDAGRVDEALKLCAFTAAAFPDSGLAISCLGEAHYDCGEIEAALATLVEADAKEPGEARAKLVLARILHDPEFVAGAAPDAASNDLARRARRILRDHATSARAALTPTGEPGERLALRGSVRDAAGNPVAGALVTLFHADARAPETTAQPLDEEEARLFAYVRTDDLGRYSFTTVRPGATGDLPQRIHCAVEATGHAPCRFDLLFRDDPKLTPQWLQRVKEGGHRVVELARDGAGTLRGACDVTLR